MAKPKKKRMTKAEKIAKDLSDYMPVYLSSSEHLTIRCFFDVMAEQDPSDPRSLVEMVGRYAVMKFYGRVASLTQNPIEINGYMVAIAVAVGHDTESDVDSMMKQLGADYVVCVTVGSPDPLKGGAGSVRLQKTVDSDGNEYPVWKVECLRSTEQMAHILDEESKDVMIDDQFVAKEYKEKEKGPGLLGLLNDPI